MLLFVCVCVCVQELGVTDNPNYKITFMLDSAAMITVHTPKRGVVEVGVGCCCGILINYKKQRCLRGSDTLTYIVAAMVCSCV